MKNNFINIALVSGGMMLGGIINYLYHPIMLRYMTLEEFGIFGSLMGVVNLMGIIYVSITLFLNKEISKNIDNPGMVKSIFIESSKVVGVMGLFFFATFTLISPLITNFLHLDSVWYVILVGTNIILGMLGAVQMAALRGLKKFEFISLNQGLFPFLKLIIGVLLVYMGYAIYGAIGGVILSGAIGLGIGYAYVKYSLRGHVRSGTLESLIQDIQKNKKELWNFFLVSLFFAVLMNIDVILVRNIFDETTAGAYAGISILGKFLIFLLLSIEMVYYGQIMESEKKQVPMELIRNPLVILFVGVIGAIIVNLYIGKFILEIIKPELISYYPIYILTLFYYGFIAFISFFSKILVGWKNYKGNILLGFSTIGLLISIYTIGSTSIESFVYCFIGTSIILSIGLGSIFYLEWKK